VVTVTKQWAEFRFFRPQALRVCLVGDFNAWREGELLMSQTEGGFWVARVRLPAGVHRFRYVADGQWFSDFAAFGVEFSRDGLCSLLRVDSTDAGCGSA
jgi:1,4-alpha-glucan branching enzyme